MSRLSHPPVRLAIVSTPRTGTNWLQCLLGRLCAVTSLSPVNPRNVAWRSLPAECVLILHWRPTPDLMALLQAERFRVVTLARHPFDVLLSILHFALREATDGWLEGEGGGEQSILGQSPTSAAFLEYATGPRAAALLDVSAAWWQEPECVKVRYEDLIHDTSATLHRVVEALNLPCRQPIADAVACAALPQMRRRSAERAHHFWQGKPNLWRELLPVAVVEALAEAHADSLARLDYACRPAAALTPAIAQARWLELIGLTEAADADVATLQRALTQVKRDLEVTRSRLAALETVGPRTLNLARRLKQLATAITRCRPFAARE